MGEIVVGVCGDCQKVYEKYVGKRDVVKNGTFFEVDDIKECPQCGWQRIPGDDERICVTPEEDESFDED